MRTATFPLTGFVLCGVAWAGTTGWEGRSVAQHAATAVDPSRALTGTKGVLPRGFMAPIARLFGLSPCDDARSWYVEDRGYASLNVNNSAISCTVWPSPDRGFAAFFPPDRTLADHLAAAPALPTLLAYGTADTRIGLQLQPALQRRCPNVRSLALDGINHTIAAPEARRIVDALQALRGGATQQAQHRR
nr:hypothetical protein [uncultured Sphingomonas sp.]